MIMVWEHAPTQDEVNSKVGKGPYPMHAGEFCGNQSINQACPPRMRFGKPRPCEEYPTVDLAEKAGFVGLYLKKTISRLFDWKVPCETPPELMEPGREGEYNQNGPGL